MVQSEEHGRASHQRDMQFPQIGMTMAGQGVAHLASPRRREYTAPECRGVVPQVRAEVQ